MNLTMKLLGWLWGVFAQWSEHLQLKPEALDLIPSGYPVFPPSSSWLTNVEDLWCSSAAQLDQHRYEWGEGSIVFYYSPLL